MNHPSSDPRRPRRPRRPRNSPVWPVVRAATGIILALTVWSALLPTGCAASSSDAAAPARCTPGNYVFCRCKDRQEGTKLCSEDGQSFGRCDPCETATNPIVEGPGPAPDGGVTDATVDPPKCGDHVVQDGEDCDDGNVIQDDGCDSVCKLSGTNPGSSRACPGLETHVWSSAVVYQGTTAGAGLVAELAQVCTSTSGGNPTRGAFGPDRLFHVVAHKTGTMTATLSDTTYDALLYVTSECQTSPKAIASLACSNDVNGVGNEALSFPVQAGASYTIVVDGAGVGQVEGSFRLTLAIR